MTFRESRLRLARLLDETETESRATREQLQDLVQELTVALEELVAAEEELRVQSDALTASAAAIDAERERYGELFEFAPDAYLVTDEHGKILEANSAASRLLGVPSRFMAGKLLASFVNEAARRELRGLLKELATAAEPVDERYLRMQSRDGASFTAAVRAAGRPASESGAGFVRWVIRDVSQRLRLEEEIRFRAMEVDLLSSLSQIARLTAEPGSGEAMLQGIVERSAAALPGCEVTVVFAAGVGRVLSASSDQRARALDEAEAREGDGPCHVAIQTAQVVELGLGEARQRWPGFAGAAEERGLHLAIAHPLRTGGGRRGALNVCAFAPLSDDSRRLLPLLVDHVVLALSNFELYETAQDLAVNLQRALEHRGIIEQAKGVLIAGQGCSDDQAFDILRRASQRLNRKLRDVALDVVANVRDGERSAPDPASERPSFLGGSRRGGADRDLARASTARVPGRPVRPAEVQEPEDRP